MAAVITLTGAMTAYADASNPPTELTEVNQVLSEGVPYHYAQYSSFSAQFTPTISGTLHIEGYQGAVYKTCVKPGVQYTDQLNVTSLDNTGAIRECEVTKGETIYIFDDFTMDEGTLTIYLETGAPLLLKTIQPTLNQVVDFNNYSMMTMTFNQNAKVTENNARISFHNRLTNATETLTSRVTGSGSKMIMVSFYSALKPYIASGAIKPTDEFTVTLIGLQSEKGEPYVDADADGNAVFTYLCGSIPTVLVSDYVPNPFLSYWPAGTEEGIVKLTFDRPLGNFNNTSATLSWGNQEGEAGEYYVEPLTFNIEGNTISIDLTGKLRTPSTMTPLFPDASYDMITLDISHIVDEFGVPVGSSGAGTIGSYSYGLTYKLLERATIAADFEPAPGSDISEASEVLVYLSDVKSISFDGFNIEYTDKDTDEVLNVVVPMADVTVNADGNGAEYTFKMPKEVMDKAKSVVITLYNLSSLDGYDHSSDVRVTYGGFAIIYSEPASNSELASINDGDIITIEANIAEKYPDMYIMYKIVDTDPEIPEDAIIKSDSWMTRQDDGSYQSTVFGNYKLYYGKEYHIVFTALESENVMNYTPMETLGSDYIIIKGSTIPYHYSVTELENTVPEPESLLNEDSTITLNFNGIVRLEDCKIVTGMGAPATPFKAVTPVDPVAQDGYTFSQSWILEFNEGYLASLSTPVLISFKAIDEEGRYVKGNEGVETDTYFIYSYYSPGEFKEIDINIPENCTSLSEIPVSYPTGINVSYEYPYSDVKVLNNLQQEVATMIDYVMDEDPDNPFAVATSGKIVLDNTITAPGYYMLRIPQGFFSLGTELDTAKNREVSHTFSIAVPEFTVVPAEGKVTSLETITIYYDGGDITLDEESGLKASWSFETDETMAQRSFRSATTDANTLILTFTTEITDPDTYHVTVPEGLVKFADGSNAPEVNLTYTIEGAAATVNVTVTPAPGSVTSIPETLVIFFDDYTEVGTGSGKAILTINNGTPINLNDAEFDWDDSDNLNKLLQPTGATPSYTDDGTYVFTFPAGYFVDESGDAIPGFTLTYTIGNPVVTYEAEITPEPGSTVAELSSITLVWNNYEEVSNGQGKASISVNGGEFTNLPDAEPSWDQWNMAVQSLGNTYTEAGNYEIFFPAGYFVLGSQGAIDSEEMTIRYTIGSSSAIESIDVEANSYTVYTLGGALLLNRADREAYNALAPGLYIVNGVKVIKK